MINIYTFLLDITELNISWAKQNYPEYYQSFKSSKRENNYLLGRALLAHVLKNTLKIDQTPLLITEKHGKPILKNIPHIGFNLSHTNNRLALIIGNSHSIGIDIEKIQERRNFEGLLVRTFSKEEINWIYKQTNFKQSFFYLWSAKEAYLKADGAGLSGLSSLTFDMPNRCIRGSLKKGQLLITHEKKESIAIYTPQHTLLSHYECQNGLFRHKAIKWDLTLYDQE